MLVLARKEHQTILIGEGKNRIVVTVLEINHMGQVRIGIEAPKDVLILRAELEHREKERN